MGRRHRRRSVGPARRLQGLAIPGALIGRPDRCPGADANFGSGPKPTPARWRASNVAVGPFPTATADTAGHGHLPCPAGCRARDGWDRPPRGRRRFDAGRHRSMVPTSVGRAAGLRIRPAYGAEAPRIMPLCSPRPTSRVRSALGVEAVRGANIERGRRCRVPAWRSVKRGRAAGGTWLRAPQSGAVGRRTSGPGGPTAWRLVADRTRSISVGP